MHMNFLTCSDVQKPLSKILHVIMRQRVFYSVENNYNTSMDSQSLRLFRRRSWPILEKKITLKERRKTTKNPRQENGPQ
jgi:hypothetical protein